MKNGFNVNGDVAEIRAKFKGSAVTIMVDAEDLDLIDGYTDNRWYVMQSYDGHRLYAYTQKMFDGKRKTIYMHRLILGFPENKVIDHRNWDGLDNRKSNIRAITQQENLQNRRVFNSSSGVRNVRWRQDRGKWKAEVWLGNKPVFLGHYDAIDDAEAAVIKFKKDNGIIIPEGGIV